MRGEGEGKSKEGRGRRKKRSKEGGIKRWKEGKGGGTEGGRDSENRNQRPARCLSKLRVRAAFAEDLSSVPSTDIRSL